MIRLLHRASYAVEAWHLRKYGTRIDGPSVVMIPFAVAGGIALAFVVRSC